MIELTKDIAKAAALDAGDRHRRANGRLHEPWNADDWNAACDEYDRLLAIINRYPDGISCDDAGKEIRQPSRAQLMARR